MAAPTPEVALRDLSNAVAAWGLAHARGASALARLPSGALRLSGASCERALTLHCRTQR